MVPDCVQRLRDTANELNDELRAAYEAPFDDKGIALKAWHDALLRFRRAQAQFESRLRDWLDSVMR